MNENSTIRRIVVVSGGTSEPSSTRMLADRVLRGVRERLAGRGIRTEARTVELRGLAIDVTTALVSGHRSDRLMAALGELARADGLVIATPVYQAGVSGLTKSFLDLIERDLVVGVPTLLAGTGGSARHSLVIDEQLRGVASYLRALTVPTALYAVPSDWGSGALDERIERAVDELTALVAADARGSLRAEAWARHPHEFGGSATADEMLQLDTDLMRLAAGGAVEPGGGGAAR